jgi:hypothetical protein
MLTLLTRRAALLLMLGWFGLSSCSHYSQSARQQRAYERYVKKNSGIRYKQQRKFKAVRVPASPPSSPDRISAVTDDSPQAMPSQ